MAVNPKQESGEEFSMEGRIGKEISAAFTCKECGKQYKFVRSLQKHMQEHRLGVKQEAPDLDSSAESLDIGVAVKLPCNYCDRSFSRKDKLRAHIKKVHPEEVEVKDTELSFGPSSESGEDRVEKSHTCDDCPKAFKNMNHLKRHKESVHSDIVISCDDCGKHFSRRDKLSAHKKNVHQHLPSQLVGWEVGY